MGFVETFLGMPWPNYVVLWKTSVSMLFSQYLFILLVLYVIFVVVLAYAEAINKLANNTLGFLAALMLFAVPVANFCASVQLLLEGWNIKLPKFFS